MLSTSAARTAPRRPRFGLLVASAMLVAVASPTAVLAQDATPAPSFEAAPGAVTLVAYTTPREAYAEIIPLFQATEAGAGVEFEESYGPSGDQSRAVEAGLPADVVALSLWPDVERLVEPGIVAADWDDNEYDGIVHNSVVAFAVRPGNPKGITGWDDLIREDVVVITPNPLTSGGAQWNILAAYQAQIDAGKTEEEAIDYLRQLGGARGGLGPRRPRRPDHLPTAGQGDVLIAYENEAIFAQQLGQPLELRHPGPHAAHREPRRGRRSRATRWSRPRPSWTSCTRRRLRPSSATRASGPRSPRSRRSSPTSRSSPTWSRSTRTWVAGRRPDRSSSTLRPASWPRSSASWVSTLDDLRQAPGRTVGRAPSPAATTAGACWAPASPRSTWG